MMPLSSSRYFSDAADDADFSARCAPLPPLPLSDTPLLHKHRHAFMPLPIFHTFDRCRPPFPPPPFFDAATIC